MEKTVFEIKTELETLWKEFDENHSIFQDKGNKAAAARARKAINEIKKHVTAYKKASVDQIKASK
jgi:biotin-(acetyl-CoA carboxylase) ligase